MHSNLMVLFLCFSKFFVIWLSDSLKTLTFFRFLLQGVVRPLLVDSLTLIVEYLVRPFMGSVVKPLLMSLHGATVTLSDTLVVLMRPLTVVLQSVRLVEVNYIRRYSVEEV